MRTWVLAVMALLVALAGCLGGGDDEATEPTETNTDTSTDTATGTQTDTGTAQPEENETAENTPPNVAFTADFQKGPAPLEVNFTLTGSDDDNDTISWTVDFGDGSEVMEGEGLPAEMNHTYTEGNFTAVAAYTDGTANGTLDLAIGVVEVPAGYTGPAPLVYTGDTLAPSATYNAGEGCWIEYMAAPTGASFHMDRDRGGWIYALEPAGDYAAIFYDSENIGSTGSGTGGEVPAGSHYVDVCGTGPGAAGGTFTLTVYPPSHPDAPA